MRITKLECLETFIITLNTNDYTEMMITLIAFTAALKRLTLS
jgi:hypothetical protein